MFGIAFLCAFCGSWRCGDRIVEQSGARMFGLSEQELIARRKYVTSTKDLLKVNFLLLSYLLTLFGIGYANGVYHFWRICAIDDARRGELVTNGYFECTCTGSCEKWTSSGNGGRG
jgi:hypothetical protein